MTSIWTLPKRIGTKPATTDMFPHSQLTQHGSIELANTLADWAFSLMNVKEEHSRISVPGARAMVMKSCQGCNQQAFMIGNEFAHIHPAPDQGSMHLKLTEQDAKEVIKQGWGEDHLLVRWETQPKGLIMVFSPRSDDELEVVKDIINRSFQYVTNTLAA